MRIVINRGFDNILLKQGYLELNLKFYGELSEFNLKMCIFAT